MGADRQSPAQALIDAAAPATPPTIVAAVEGEITPGTAPVWEPSSYGEWESRERTKTFLAAWSEQAADERQLRRTFASWIFWLITGQVAAAFAVVVADGLGVLRVDTGVMQVLIPSVLTEVFGLGYVVTKFLFSLPLRQSLDALVQGTKPGDPITPAATPPA